MDPRTWKKPWSRLLKGKAIEVETPRLHLELTTRCMEQVNRLCSIRGSPLLKFNGYQCVYLATKLQQAIQSANSIIKDVNKEFLLLTHLQEMEQLLKIFRLLNAMGVEVEGLVQNCCKESWIQSAIMFMDMLDHIATIALNLEFCTTIFSSREPQKNTAWMYFDATRLRGVEVQIVKEMVHLDGIKLIMDLKNVIESYASKSTEWQLATILLGRLEKNMLHPVSRLQNVEELALPLMITSLQQMPNCLGKGTFAIVHKATWLGVEVAKKTFYGPSSADFLQEVSIFDGLSHPNIVSLLWSMTDGKRCHLVMELMDGDLFTFMHQRMEVKKNQGSPFNIQEAVDLILQIGEGMLYLHDKRVVHRDLKSHNILIRCEKMAKGNVEYLQVKVSDFGLSKTKEKSATYSDMSSNVGTTRWMAPEVMKVDSLQSDDVGEEGEVALNYPFKIDIYSFGMVCFEILTGDVPFSNLNHSEVKKAVLRGDRPPLPKECPYRLRKLIKACWSAEARMRPSFSDICEELSDLKYANLQTYWKAMFYQCPLEDIVSIDELVAKLSSPIAKDQQSAIDHIHLWARKSFNHRIYIKKQEAMPLLVLLYYSRDLKIQEHASAALRALAVDNGDIKEDHLDSAIGPIIEVLKCGRMKACENATKALMNMSYDLGGKVEKKIRNSNVVPALVPLLQGGSMEGKEDAMILFFRTCHFNKDLESAVRAGIVPPLMDLISQHSDDTMIDDAMRILNILAHDREGLNAIISIKTTSILVKIISILVKIIASESQYRWKRDRAALILLKLCLHDAQFIKEAKESNAVEHLTHFTQPPQSSSKSCARELLDLLQK